MPLDVKPRVIDAIAALPEAEAVEVQTAILSIPAAFGRPHVHSGLGLRQLRPGYYEARVGLALRVVCSRDAKGLVVELLGNHDDVRRFLRGL